MVEGIAVYTWSKFSTLCLYQAEQEKRMNPEDNDYIHGNTYNRTLVPRLIYYLLPTQFNKSIHITSTTKKILTCYLQDLLSF